MTTPARPEPGLSSIIAGIAAPALFIGGIVMAFIAVPAYRAHQLLAHGLPATAVVQSLQDTDEREGGLPMEDVHILVTRPDGTSYPAVVREQFSPQNSYFYAPGNQFAVKYDAQNPNRVIVPLGQTITVHTIVP